MSSLEEEKQQSLNYVFNKLIPRIQKHVNETGHIWNLNITCHECMTVRFIWMDNNNFVKSCELQQGGFTPEQANEVLFDEIDTNSEIDRRLSD